MTEQEALDKFGELLIRSARDVPLSHSEKTVLGEMKNADARENYEALAQFTPEQIALIRRVVTEAVDETLHHLLWMFEQHEDTQNVVLDGEQQRNLAEISDGLSGELYTEDGWIQRFSRSASPPGTGIL